MKRILLVTSLLLTVAIVLAACGSSAPATEEAPPPATEEPAPGPTATSEPEPTATTDTGFDSYSAWAGDWEGSWTNTTFGSTGPIAASIMFEPDGTGTFAFDAGGFIFGAVDPPEVVLDATFDASGVMIELPGNEIFGDVMVTIKPDGTFEMVGDLVPTAGIARVEAMGTFTEDTLEGTYTVLFEGEGVAEGTFAMMRPE